MNGRKSICGEGRGSSACWMLLVAGSRSSSNWCRRATSTEGSGHLAPSSPLHSTCSPAGSQARRSAGPRSSDRQCRCWPWRCFAARWRRRLWRRLLLGACGLYVLAWQSAVLLCTSTSWVSAREGSSAARSAVGAGCSVWRLASAPADWRCALNVAGSGSNRAFKHVGSPAPMQPHWQPVRLITAPIYLGIAVRRLGPDQSR